jgi:hypothetical protein
LKKLWAEFDIQDGLVIAAYVCIITGSAMIYRPAGFIVAGLMFIGQVFLIERDKSSARRDKRGPS